MEEFKQGRADKTHWVLVGRDDPRGDLCAALDGYTAACDYPSCLYYKELLRLNPTARVVLTVRDADRWYASSRQTNWAFPEVLAQTWILCHVAAGFLRDANDMVLRKAIGGQQHIADRVHCIAAYRRHVEEVKRTVLAAQLLVIDVSEGWAPQCAFLGKPVPAAPFPHLNEAAQFKRAFRYVRIADRVLSVGQAVGLCSLASYLLRGRGSKAALLRHITLINKHRPTTTLGRD
jgi:hypothetical protein